MLIACYFFKAQSISRLIESIKHYDYYHTKLYAHKLLSKNKKKAAAAYALAYVYYQNYQPFHNIDSADKYIHLAILNYPRKPYISKYGKIDSMDIYNLYDSVTIAQFRRIQHQLYPKVYDIFLSQHPFVNQELKNIIKKHQYKKVVEYVQQINKSDTTFYYLTEYPQNPQLQALEALLDKQIFYETTTHQTAAEYLLFLRNYGKSN